jgi:hypothetical protein
MHFAVAGGAVACPGVVARTVIMCICVVQRPRVHVAAGDSKSLLEIVEPRLHVLHVCCTHKTNTQKNKHTHTSYCVNVYIDYIDYIHYIT